MGYMSNKKQLGRRADSKLYYRVSMQNEDGFTVVELIVALIVGTIMIGSAILMMTSEEHISQSHRDLVVANAFVEQRIEALRSSGYLALSDGTTDISSQMPAELNSPRSGSVVVSTPSSGIKQIDVSITYNDQGAARTFAYRTYVGELGVGQY